MLQCFLESTDFPVSYISGDLAGEIQALANVKIDTDNNYTVTSNGTFYLNDATSTGGTGGTSSIAGTINYTFSAQYNTFLQSTLANIIATTGCYSEYTGTAWIQNIGTPTSPLAYSITFSLVPKCC